MRSFITLLVISLIQLSSPSFGEDVSNVEKAELSRETSIKKYPTLDAPSIGRLPKGTIVELSGEEENAFAEAEVELANGTVTNGWVEITSIKGREREKAKEKPKPVKKTGKLVVPKDEGILLRREQTFFYGISGGGNYSILNYVEAEEPFVGMSFNGEAHVGIYFNSYSRAQLNVGYFRAGGTDSEGIAAGFGFLDITLEGQLVLDEKFLVFAGLGYLNGIGIIAAPTTFAIEGAADLSTPSSLIGVGYRMPINDVSSIGIKASYLFGFKRDPIGVQAFVFSAFIDFEG